MPSQSRSEVEKTLHCGGCGARVHSKIGSDGRTYWGHAPGSMGGLCDPPFDFDTATYGPRIIERRWTITPAGERPRKLNDLDALCRSEGDFDVKDVPDEGDAPVKTPRDRQMRWMTSLGGSRDA